MNAMSLADAIILIPAYRPDKTLVSVVRQLAEAGFPHIVVVNDGSGPACDAVFAEVAAVPGVVLERHAVNLGKGAALKTGINRALCLFPDAVGIVTADADGQHLPADIRAVAETLLTHPRALVLGSRAFDGEVPLRSRIGNTLTRDIMETLVGSALTDTQTGLRGIPVAFAASLLKLTSSGYEFELDMLIAARQNSVEVLEHRIQTVYEPGNKSSHFNPAIDSMKIYFVLLRFTAASLVTALIDNLIFYLLWRRGAPVLVAQIAARSLAAAFNYIVVRRAVFQTRASHAATLPRFLTVFAAGGAISYGLIQFLVTTGHLPVFGSKIAVETLLFFANFLAQRDWVFLQPGSAAEKSARQPVSGRTLGLSLLLLVPLGVEIYGFATSHVLSESTWIFAGLPRFFLFLRFFLGLALVFGLFARRYFLPAVSLVILICSALAVGILPVATVLLFLFSTTITGWLLFGEETDPPLALLGGIAVWIALMYATARLPVHYPVVYVAVMLLPIAIGFRKSRRLAERCLAVLNPAAAPSVPAFFSLALLLCVLTADWLITLKPEASTDGLAMHLAIAMNIAKHHAYTIDWHHLVWALMPIGADFSYTAVYLPGGEYATHLLNFAMLALIATMLQRAARRFTGPAAAYLLAALFVSSPMVYLVTGSMFVENFVAAMVLGWVLALWRFEEERTASSLLLTAVLIGTSMALKTGALAIGLPGIVLLVALAFFGKAERKPAFAAIPIAALLALGLGAIPYVIAWRNTGNPFFPFAAANFESSFMGKGVKDVKFLVPLSWHMPFDLTFGTQHFFEGQNGSFGFQYLLFLPLAAVALIAAKSFRARSVAALGLIATVVVAASAPNARYFYFATPLLTLAFAAGFAWLRERDRHLFHACCGAALLASLANLWMLPTADWLHREFYSSPMFTERGRAEYLHHTAPIREVIAFINRHDTDGKTVVIADSSMLAGLEPPVHTVAWHDYQFDIAMEAAGLPLSALDVLRKANTGWLIVDRERHRQVAADPEDPLGSVVFLCGETAFTSANLSAVRLLPDCEARLEAARPTCPPGPPLRAGDKPDDRIDETDFRIHYLGPWGESGAFPETWNHTLRYANAGDSEACFTIYGTGFDYFYTKAFNRGFADLYVDGQLQSSIDLYSPATQWQASTRISGLPQGRHQISLRVPRRKNPAASDYYVDLDAVRVF